MFENEEHDREQPITNFEKILAATKRAKELHQRQVSPLVSAQLKPHYLALAEFKHNKLEVVPEEDEAFDEEEDLLSGSQEALEE